ncbi:MAG: PQQ-binding-like beta-propeller repeat protein [Gammaproteobacteria bacterium]
MNCIARALVVSVVAYLAAPAGAQPIAAPPDGRSVYLAHCAQCHEQVTPQVPNRETLQRMPSTRIMRALDAGAMLAIAMTMHRDERIAVAKYLGTDAAESGPSPAAFCADRSVRLAATPKATWNGWSPTAHNARFQSAAGAGLTAEQVPRLKLKWAFGFAGDVAAFAAPTVIDDQIFVGSAGGLVHAMRAEDGCLQWVFQANGPVRAASVVASIGGGRHALLFGDLTGWFYAVVAETGELLWKQQVEAHDSTRLTAAAVVHDGVVYVPVSSWEEARAGDPTYPCCTFRGSLVALRVRDGVQLWKTYLVDPSKEIGKNASNALRFGPSGVGVWATPTVDAKRHLLYVATGDAYTEPASSMGDAVLAVNMRDGRVVWTKQITEGDVYNGSCRHAAANCPQGAGPDYDFGSSAILLDAAGQREILLAGQKSGVVFALDPTKRGDILWQTRIGKGGTNGGIEWGMATDGDVVYATVSDVGRTRQDNNLLDPRRYALDTHQGGGLTALRVKDGSKVWYAAPQPCPASAPVGCSPAQPGAVSQIPGVVFATSYDGHIRAHATADGRVLWDYATARSFTTVNQVPASGGSIDGPGPVVVNGLLLVSSGYPRNGGMPGNVLLAFGAD